MAIRKNAPVFLALETAIIEKGITKKSIAVGLGITETTLSRKLTGQVEFTLKEVKYLHHLFIDKSVETLFNMDE